MLDFKTVLFYSVHSILTSLKSPIYWIVVVIVYFQYRKLAKMEKMILGSHREPLYKRMITSTILGILGGIVASIIFILLGTTVEGNDFLFILPTALLLSLIHPRFICFSYAGGLISLISLIFGFPKINVVSVMTVVAVLHLVESLLIITDGHSGRMPIFMEKDNDIVGGFNMNRFWPMPFLILVQGNRVYPIVILAVLGYGDYVLTKFPKDKTKETSGMLLLFSLVLLLLSQLSKQYNVLLYPLAISSPLLHELIIQFGRSREDTGRPIFVPSSMGLKILDTLPDGVGEKIGLKTGDILISINGNRINSKRDIVESLMMKPKYIWLDVLDMKKGLITKEYKNYREGIDSLDVLVIPKIPEYAFVMEEAKSPIKRLMEKIKK
ncbi:hypothetical protein [Anaerosalibacter sp. Marseille-P3206]|uniref:hypothetical protein n=1 Tax=Anaerosalibacter sp. Marseille-P3206 TaxID=1871005 RepID=UPI000984C785|nr:hypothetical protein [Anaerosalibacter sp. Marseille-P3206]